MIECLMTEAKVNPNQEDEVLSVICDVCDRDWVDVSPHVDLHSFIGDHVCGESA